MTDSACPRRWLAIVALASATVMLGGASFPAERVRLLTEELERREIAFRYMVFFRCHRLEPDIREKVTELLAAFEIAMEPRTVIASSRTEGGPTGPVTTSRKSVRSTFLIASRELLGKEAADALAEFQRVIPARDAVRRFAGGASLVGSPLSIEQGERLIAAVADASKGFRSGGAVELASVDWSAVDAQAKSILSADQFELFTSTDLSLRWSSAQTSAWRTALAGATPSKQTGPGASDPETAGREFLATHPALREALLKARAARIREQSWLVCRELRFSAAQIVELEEILANGPESLTTSVGPSGSGRMVFRFGERLSAEDYRRRLTKLIGPDRYEEYRAGRYALSGTPWSDLAAWLSLTEQPLTVEQAAALRRVLHEEQQREQGAGSRRTPAEYWEAVDGGVKGFLSVQQRAALRLNQLREELRAVERGSSRRVRDR